MLACSSTSVGPWRGGRGLPKLCPVEPLCDMGNVSHHDDPEQMAALVLDRHGNDCRSAREFAIRQRGAARNKDLVFFWNAVAQIIMEGAEGH